MSYTIKDLLKALKEGPTANRSSLANTKETWERIGRNDKFEELGLIDEQLDSFLKDWIAENPYTNIINK